MPRPFPFALSIGTDICHIVRIYNILTHPRVRAQLFVRKVLNPAEILASESWLKSAAELDSMKTDEKIYSDIPRKAIHSKVWPMAHFLSGR
jgi:hypothetical protein